MDNDYITALSYDEKLVFIKMFCKLIKADGVAVRHLCGAENNIRTTSRRQNLKQKMTADHNKALHTASSGHTPGQTAIKPAEKPLPWRCRPNSRRGDKVCERVESKVFISFFSEAKNNSRYGINVLLTGKGLLYIQ